MLLVKTKIGPSPIAGIGLFADELISKGAYIWRFKKGLDMRYDEAYIASLEGPVRSYFETYAYQNPKTKKYVLCADDARFTNHSDMPNALCVADPEDEETATVAARDIAPGEEITVDYREFDTNPFHGFEGRRSQANAIS